MLAHWDKPVTYYKHEWRRLRPKTCILCMRACRKALYSCFFNLVKENSHLKKQWGPGTMVWDNTLQSSNTTTNTTLLGNIALPVRTSVRPKQQTLVWAQSDLVLFSFDNVSARKDIFSLNRFKTNTCPVSLLFLFPSSFISLSFPTSII